MLETKQGQRRRVTTKEDTLSIFEIVQKYCKLSKLVHPSDNDSNQIAAILELAQYDPELSSLINEADHLIAYELGLSQDVPIVCEWEKYSHQEKSFCLAKRQ